MLALLDISEKLDYSTTLFVTKIIEFNYNLTLQKVISRLLSILPQTNICK